MNDKTKEYLELMPYWRAVQIVNDQDEMDRVCRRLDELWNYFSDEEIEYVESKLKEANDKLVASAPKSLGMVDKMVIKNESPREND